MHQIRLGNRSHYVGRSVYIGGGALKLCGRDSSVQGRGGDSSAPVEREVVVPELITAGEMARSGSSSSVDRAVRARAASTYASFAETGTSGSPRWCACGDGVCCTGTEWVVAASPCGFSKCDAVGGTGIAD